MALILGVAAMTWSRGKSLRGWLRQHPWIGFAWVGVFMVPTAVLGNVKIGGSLSPFAMTTWFLAAAGIAGLAQLAATTQRARARFSAALLAGFMTAGISYELGAEQRGAAIKEAVFQLRHLADNPQEQAVAFAKAHPDEVLFVSNPLIGLLADGALHHSFKGMMNRVASGFPPPSPEQLRAHNPPRLRYLALPGTGRFGRWQRPDVLYPDFVIRVRPEGLDHHSAWMRARDSGEPAARHGSPRS
jgi:hypothetical protein